MLAPTRLLPAVSRSNRDARPFVVVAAAQNDSHAYEAVAAAVRSVVDHLEPKLSSLVKRGDRVFLKVNMGCSGYRQPEERYTSHPAYVQAIIECLVDCGARVTFGDDVSRTAHYERIWQKTGMSDVARRTGARLVDFVQAGGREVRGFLHFPRTYLVTNLALDTDVVVNAASSRSLSPVILSGAVKNMFGTVLGLRKLRIHKLFPDPSDFARVIADICRVVRPTVSFLDLTTVIEGQGVAPAIRNVGLILGSTDPVALDTVAAHSIGYEELQIWTNIHGEAMGLGCNRIDRISVRGEDWSKFEPKHLRWPELPMRVRETPIAQISRRLNATVFRPRPVVARHRCTGCGECANRCPVGAIQQGPDKKVSINLKTCADCGCCLRVCGVGAVQSEFVGTGRFLRGLIGPRNIGAVEDANVMASTQ